MLDCDEKSLSTRLNVGLLYMCCRIILCFWLSLFCRWFVFDILCNVATNDKGNNFWCKIYHYGLCLINAQVFYLS